MRYSSTLKYLTTKNRVYNRRQMTQAASAVKTSETLVAPIPRWVGNMMVNVHQISAALSGSCCGEELNSLSPIQHFPLHIFLRPTAMIGAIVQEEYNSPANSRLIELSTQHDRCQRETPWRREGGSRTRDLRPHMNRLLMRVMCFDFN